MIVHMVHPCHANMNISTDAYHKMFKKIKFNEGSPQNTSHIFNEGRNPKN